MNNIPEFSVTEISNLTKQILEENFNLIKVRGEISSVKNFKGHLYFSIKDENFILNSVCWSSKVPFLQKFFIKILDPYNWEAFIEGPKTLIPLRYQ